MTTVEGVKHESTCRETPKSVVEFVELCKAKCKGYDRRIHSCRLRLATYFLLEALKEGHDLYGATRDAGCLSRIGLSIEELQGQAEGGEPEGVQTQDVAALVQYGKFLADLLLEADNKTVSLLAEKFPSVVIRNILAADCPFKAEKGQEKFLSEYRGSAERALERVALVANKDIIVTSTLLEHLFQLCAASTVRPVVVKIYTTLMLQFQAEKVPALVKHHNIATTQEADLAMKAASLQKGINGLAPSAVYKKSVTTRLISKLIEVFLTFPPGSKRRDTILKRSQYFVPLLKVGIRVIRQDQRLVATMVDYRFMAMLFEQMSCSMTSAHEEIILVALRLIDEVLLVNRRLDYEDVWDEDIRGKICCYSSLFGLSHRRHFLQRCFGLILAGVKKNMRHMSRMLKEHLRHISFAIASFCGLERNRATVDAINGVFSDHSRYWSYKENTFLNLLR